MLSNFLIGLREGLEATLIVSILVAYLVRTDRRDRLPAVWAGVGLAVVLCVGFAALLDLTANSLSDTAEEVFAGLTSVFAVALVTWMVFWMRNAARGMAHELHGKIDAAVAVGPVALLTTALFAVSREGLETALFLWSNAKSTGRSATPLGGALIGILVAVLLGYLMYRKAVTVNLSKFFAWTGGALIVIAAGVLSYGIGDLQEAGVLKFGTSTAYDVTSWYHSGAWYDSLLGGIFHFSPNPTVLQVVVWATYLGVVMTCFLLGLRTSHVEPAPVESTKDLADTPPVEAPAPAAR